MALALIAVGACERAPDGINHIEDLRVAHLDEISGSDTATFSQIASAVLLSDQLILVDSRESSVSVYRDGVPVPLGRKGRGPGEYVKPSRVLRVSDTVALVYDSGTRRLVEVTAQGIGDTHVAIPERLVASQGVEAADTVGGLYFRAGADYFREDGEEVDSVSVIRWRPVLGDIDTVAKVRIPVLASATMQSGAERLEVKAEVPFTPTDTWTALPEGSLAIVRISPIRLEVRTPDGEIWRGSPLTSKRRFAVTEAETEGFTSLTFVDVDIPKTKPVIAGQQPVVAPTGAVWVELSGSPDAPREYLIFDRLGEAHLRARLEHRDKLLVVAVDTVYAVRTDQWGVQRLVRYRPPEEG